MSSKAFVPSSVFLGSSPGTNSSFTPAITQNRYTATLRPCASTPRMLFKLFNNSSTTARPLIDIPQRIQDVSDREKKLQAARKKYQWKYEGIGTAAMIDSLPLPEELPAAGWLAQIFEVVLRIALNQLSNGVEGATHDSVTARVGELAASITVKVLRCNVNARDISSILAQIGDIVKPTAHSKNSALQEYKDLFDTIKLGKIAANDQYLRDDIFGMYRIAGPNPMALQKLTTPIHDLFPHMTDEVLQGIVGFSGDSLAAAASENRLYYIDYKRFDGIETGLFEEEKKSTFQYSPKALFAVPRVTTDRQKLLPLAIYCDQNGDSPMYSANTSHTDKVSWIAAKYTVQAADAIEHEMVHHLGRCHLLAEAATCALHRTLPDTHPLFRLLKPHYYGTALINAAAVAALVNNGGIVDQLAAPDISFLRTLAADSVSEKTFDFNDTMPDVEMTKRGVMDPSLHFPYRDDALAHWTALTRFVGAYVAQFYGSDEDVRGDYELQNFAREMVVDAKINGFGEGHDGSIATREYLVRALSMLIFNSSVQHAAVNFTQSTHVSFAPAMALSGASPAPSLRTPFASIDQWAREMVPDINLAQQQLTLMTFLSGVKYTQIGEYKAEFPFAGEPVNQALQKYQEALEELGGKIHLRNREERNAGLPPYNFLIPENVPQSINI